MAAETPNHKEKVMGCQRVQPDTRTILYTSLDDHQPHCRYYGPTLSQPQAQQQLPYPPDESAKVVHCHLREVTTCLDAAPPARRPQMYSVHRKIPHAEYTNQAVMLGRGLPYQVWTVETDSVRVESSRPQDFRFGSDTENKCFAGYSDGHQRVDRR